MNWPTGNASSWEQSRGRAVGGIVLGIVGALLLIAFIGGGWWLRQQQEQIDESTYCPISGPRAVHALLIDRSDPITPQQAQRIRQEVSRVRQRAAGERVDIYIAEGTVTDVLMPVFSYCSPGQGKDANQLYQNPEQIQKRFEEKFGAVLDATMDSLLQATTRTNSPILESIKAAAVTSFGALESGKQPLRLTVVSDLIQHSEAYSQFRDPPDFDAIAPSAAWRMLQADLKGAEVEILYLLRPTARRGGKAPIQNRAHQQFWERAIGASNGTVVSMETL